MSRRDRQVFFMMLALFVAVFCPIMFFSSADLHEILLLGVRHPAGLVDYVLEAAGFQPTETLVPEANLDFIIVSTADYTATPTKASASTPLAIPSSTRSVFLSPTHDEQGQYAATPTLIPSIAPTTGAALTATPVPPTETARPAPTQTPVPPTSTPVPPTPRPTRTPAPTPRPTDIPTAVPPTAVPPTEPPPTEPPPTEPPATEAPTEVPTEPSPGGFIMLSSV